MHCLNSQRLPRRDPKGSTRLLFNIIGVSKVIFKDLTGRDTNDTELCVFRIKFEVCGKTEAKKHLDCLHRVYIHP